MNTNNNNNNNNNVVEILTSTSFTLMDWKNKEGKTLQLFIHPLSSSVGDLNFEFRLSCAFMQVYFCLLFLLLLVLFFLLLF